VADGYMHTLLLFYEKYRDCSSRLSEVFAFKKIEDGGDLSFEKHKNTT
jgi:hypothetical protein